MGFSGKKEKINGKAFIMIALLVFFVSGAWGAVSVTKDYFCTGKSEQECRANEGLCGPLQYQQCNGNWVKPGVLDNCVWNSDRRTCRCDVYIESNYCTLGNCGLDSARCVQNGNDWINTGASTCGGKSCYTCDEQCQCEELGGTWTGSSCNTCSDSTWYNCTSVFTENNVIRSQVTEYNCDSVIAVRYVLGSCLENGFCEGDAVTGVDTCSTVLDTAKCRFGGQNGSLCTYVCADGKIHSCQIHWTPGQPAEYQNCPPKPYASCIYPNSSSSSPLDSLDSLPDPPYSQSSSSVSPEPDPECPECDYLQEIRDTLHRANEQRRYANYVLDEIKEDVGGFGAQFSSIVTNTAVTVNRLNTSNSSLSAIESTNLQIANKLDELDLGNISVSVDSVVVHVEGSGDSVVPGASWTFYDLDSLPVWRDTISQVTRIMQDINSQVDTLVQDSSGENALKKYLPDIRKIYDKVSDFYSGFTLPAVFDTLSSRLGLDTVTVAEAQAVADKIIPLGDSAYIDGNFYCEEHPDAAVCVELDSSELAVLVGPDTVDANEFFRVQDSILEANRAYLDSLKKRDSIQDTLGLDELAGDSAKIREKLDFLFLPENTLEQCFDFRLNTTLGRWSYNLFIDFADLFGLDLCDLIRKIVRILTFILIVFTTIKGYIRAFGGGGSGGDV